MLLVFTVQVLFNFFHDNVIFVGPWREEYASGVVACLPRYGKLVPFLVPVEDTVLGLGVAPCSIRFCRVVVGLLSPLLWQEQGNWGSGK